MKAREIPRATYRLQFSSEFTFQQAIALIPYFKSLGISHLYASPLFRARPGSPHGYDIIDPTVFNPEIGTKDEFKTLVKELRKEKMGLIFDIVPNHLFIGDKKNAWWEDVLTKESNSPFANYFDITLPITDEKPHYRRFFDISELAGLRVEDDQVFEATHKLTLELLEEGLLDGLRIDHIDGLYDPKEYLDRIHKLSPYTIVEKILTGEERLRSDWKIEGTVGYDFLNRVNGLFVNQKSKKALEAIYEAFTGVTGKPQSLIHDAKRLLLTTSFLQELAALSLGDISEEALIAMLTCFPVYRSYIRANEGTVSTEDKLDVLLAYKRASEQGVLGLDAVKDLLLNPEEAEDFVMRFQQLTGPLMAKGYEDTFLYRFFPLLSLNEVGSTVERFGTSVEEFHAHNCYQQKKWPHTMLTTSTHDTKRSEDIRMRIDVLSEQPEEWGRALTLFRELNASVKEEGAPDANEEYFIYQTIIGSFPLSKNLEGYAERIKAYMNKALKEAKIHTSWVDRNFVYEEKVDRFIEKILNPSSDFFKALNLFLPKVVRAGLLNSLSQVLLKLTSPGVPDIYQGNELWDFSLVDPDNRRPVDFRAISKLLNDTKEKSLCELFHRLEDGDLKLSFTSKVLEIRRQFSDLFTYGEYVPLAVSGERKERVIAFTRSLDGESIVIVSSRFFAPLLSRLQEGWGKTHVELPQSLQHQHFINLLTGLEYVEGACLEQIFSEMPFAILRQK